MNDMRKLMEAAEQLNEAYVEYRDPGGHFQVIYEPPRGYFAIARNDLPDISGESFDDLDDAIEHAEISLGVAYDDAVYDGEIGASPVEEEFATEPDRYMPFSGGGGIEDSFNDSNPARDMHIKAVNDVPSLYMKAGDTMYIKPTENQGEVYSEENGLEYDWDWIVELMMRGEVEETDDGYPGETEPYIEEAKAKKLKVNYDSWKTAIPKSMNEYHVAVLKLMDDGKARERSVMIRQATDLDPNPVSRNGFAGWNKIDYDLYKMGYLKVVDILPGGKKVFKITPAGKKAWPQSEWADPMWDESIEENVVGADSVEDLLAHLNRQMTKASRTAEMAAGIIKRSHPEDKEAYNLVTDIEMELDQLRKRVFDAR